jgi:leucyl aminopeptidase (aminopeptidase T)
VKIVSPFSKEAPMIRKSWPSATVVAIGVALCSAPVGAQAPDLKVVARNLVQSAKVAPGEKVLITGSSRDAQLLEHIAVETMKAGGQPLIALASEDLSRRSYDEVPESYDSQEPTLGLGLVNLMDVQISVDVGESEAPLAHVPQGRLTARAKAQDPVGQAFLKRGVRFVNLGNGLYPTATTSQRLGVEQPMLASTFWKAASVPADSLRTRGEALRASIGRAKTLTITHPNGTNLTFAVDAGRGFVSDGAITPEKVKQGGAAVQTWLPAGELILPAAAGSANGKLVVDKLLWRGKEVGGLTLSYSAGRLTSMTATSNLEGLKAAYDSAGGAKDQFGYLDIGLNPETALPLGSGQVVWTVPGSITVGLGDNRGFGGTNASEFGLATQLPQATLVADGATVIEKGALK